MNLLIVGRGKVGTTLARSLAESGRHAVSTMGRRIDRQKLRAAHVVVLAVPDSEIESVAERIGPELRPRAVVLHCAGAQGLEVLDACAARGASVGAMHPFASFPTKRTNLSDTTFTIDGSAHAVTAARAIAKACGARTVVGQTANPLYHASAAFAANGAASLAFVAVGWLERLGFGRRDAERAVGGILESVGRNIQKVGVPDALTGPVARGDAHTVTLHRRALQKVGRRALIAYDAVLPIIVETAKASGLPSRRANVIRRLADKPPE